MLRAGEVENTKKKSFSANWLKEKCPVVSREESCDALSIQDLTGLIWFNEILYILSPDDVEDDPRDADPEHENPLHYELLHGLGCLLSLYSDITGFDPSSYAFLFEVKSYLETKIIFTGAWEFG